jgi:signal peptidase I
MSPIDRERREEALRAANRGRGSRVGRRGSQQQGRAGMRSRPPSSVRWAWTVREVLRLLPAALLLFLVLRTFVVEAFRIPSGSMERTLLVGDFLLVNKLVYGAEVPFTDTRLPALHAPRRNDLLVFAWPVDPSKSFVKRLVGLPGDTVSMQGGQLRRNGLAVDEPYVVRSGRPGEPLRDEWGPLVVPAQHLFVLGDNRDSSLDSRYWGFVPDRLLIGAPWIVYYSYAPDSTSSMAWLTRIRWPRIGRAVR